MYAAPLNAAGVLRVDPATRTTSLLALPDGCDAEQGCKWLGSLVAGSDGAMYAAPCNAAGVLQVVSRAAEPHAKAGDGATVVSAVAQRAVPEPEPDGTGAEEGEPPATAALRAELGEADRTGSVPRTPRLFCCRADIADRIPTAVA